MYLAHPNEVGLAPGNVGVGDFFSDLWGGVKTYTTNTANEVIGSTKAKVVNDATTAVNKAVDSVIGGGTTSTATPTATETATPEPVTNTAVTTQTSTAVVPKATVTTAQTQAGIAQLEAWSAWLTRLTPANCKAEWDTLDAARKAQAEQAAKALNIKIPCLSVANQAQSFLAKNKSIFIAGAIGVGGFYLSKSVLGAAIAGAGSYWLATKYL